MVDSSTNGVDGEVHLGVAQLLFNLGNVDGGLGARPGHVVNRPDARPLFDVKDDVLGGGAVLERLVDDFDPEVVEECRLPEAPEVGVEGRDLCLVVGHPFVRTRIVYGALM
jgi:hypothetical protein